MNLRRLSIQARRQHLAATYGVPDLLDSPDVQEDCLALTDSMIEYGIGHLGLPLGIATGFVVDGKSYAIPMATEEPSVIAGASFAATVVGREGGFQTEATEPLMAFQVFWDDPDGDLAGRLRRQLDDIAVWAEAPLRPLAEFGGGLRDMAVQSLADGPFVKLQVIVDVRDAQGANALNTCAEHLGDKIAGALDVRPLMAIVTNYCEHRRATARCVLPADRVAHLCRGRYAPQESVRRVAAAGRIAQCDRDRAVTHNKGIMNGITALALATGNDTRALEAAVHAWAARDGHYRGLSTYTQTPAGLEACIELPLPLATVGGATQHHPTAAFSLKLLDSPDGPTLARIAASLGLAQNLAALCALVSTGIQQGHMPLHHKKQHHEKHT